MQSVGCGSTEENITWGKSSKKLSAVVTGDTKIFTGEENILFAPLNEKHSRGLGSLFLRLHGIEKLRLWQDTVAPISAPPYWGHRLSQTTVLLNLLQKTNVSFKIPIIIFKIMIYKAVSLVHSDLQFSWLLTQYNWNPNHSFSSSSHSFKFSAKLNIKNALILLRFKHVLIQKTQVQTGN